MSASGGAGGWGGLLGRSGSAGTAGGAPVIDLAYDSADDYMTVKLKVNGLDVQHVEVDTGSAGLVIPITFLDANNLGPTLGVTGMIAYGDWGRFYYTVYAPSLEFGNGMTTAGTPVAVVDSIEVNEGSGWVPLDQSEWSDSTWSASIQPTMGVGPYTGSTIASPISTLPSGLGQGLLINYPEKQLAFGQNPLPSVNKVAGWFYTALTVTVTSGSQSQQSVNVTSTIDSGGIGGGVTQAMLPANLAYLGVGDELPPGTVIQVFAPDGQILYQTTVTESQYESGDAPSVWTTSLGFNTGIIPFLQGPIYFSYTPAYVPNPANFYGGTAVFDFTSA
ncbi:hypothetical protein BayCH28_14605 [Mycolicibacterium sp. CH28]|nr:hypothetical protein BayCH28_14605 [Mycolicibacterium sp. CH28]